MSLRFKQFAVALLAVLALAVGPVHAADPFYTNLLRDGAGARSRGDFEAAIEDLTIACFGLLDEPTLLAQGLVELAIAQADAGSSVELERSIDRLLQAEEQFQGYSQASLTADARQQFEDLLYRRVDPARFDGLAAFAALAKRRELDAVMAAGPDQRRLMLQDRLATDPGNTEWLRMAADLETAQGQPAAALAHLSALLDLNPNDPYLRCERFRAATQAGLCDVALPDIPACPTDATDAQLAQPILHCYVAQTSWQAAASYLDTLPASLRSTSKIRKLDRQIQKEIRNLPQVAVPLPQDAGSELDAGLAPTGTAFPVTGDSPEDLTDNEAPVEEAPSETETNQADFRMDPDTSTADAETRAPLPDPCDPFRSSARAGRCEAALAAMATCLGAAAEPKVAPAIMKCHTEDRDWAAALAFAELLPPQVRGLSKIRKLETRATRQLAKQPAPPAAESGDATIPAETEETGPGTDLTDSPPSRDAQATESALAPSNPIDPEASSAVPPPPAALAAARRALAAASTSDDITRAYAVTSRLAMDYPTHPESQILAAQGAYRAAQWDKAIAFFDAAGGPPTDQPLLQFYNAVALFETGRAREAADLLALALPKIRRTPFVDSYAARINTAAGRSQ